MPTFPQLEPTFLLLGSTVASLVKAFPLRVPICPGLDHD
jgi:hypothetical protein